MPGRNKVVKDFHWVCEELAMPETVGCRFKELATQHNLFCGGRRLDSLNGPERVLRRAMEVVWVVENRIFTVEEGYDNLQRLCEAERKNVRDHACVGYRDSLLPICQITLWGQNIILESRVG